MKTVKKKVVELTPDWLLSRFIEGWLRDVNGRVVISTQSVESGNWIALALETLGIKWRCGEMGEGTEDASFLFIFQIDDIKIECPMCYERFMEDEPRKSIEFPNEYD